MVYITLSINQTDENEPKNDDKNENFKKSFKRNLLSDIENPAKSHPNNVNTC